MLAWSFAPRVMFEVSGQKYKISCKPRKIQQKGCIGATGSNENSTILMHCLITFRPLRLSSPDPPIHYARSKTRQSDICDSIEKGKSDKPPPSPRFDTVRQITVQRFPSFPSFLFHFSLQAPPSLFLLYPRALRRPSLVSTRSRYLRSVLFFQSPHR